MPGESLTTHRENNDTRNVAIALRNRAAYLVALERYDEALISSRAALTASRDTQHEISVAWSLHFAAVAALRPGDDAEHLREDRLRAARLLGYVDARLSALKSLREYTEEQEYDKILPVLRDALSVDQVRNA